jgi:hypothetical protein
MQGLRKRPTYNELIQEVENSDDIIKKYPDRRALFMRNHPYLTTLDGESFMDAMDSQQDAITKEQQKDLMIRTYSAQTQTSHLENKAMATPLRQSFAWRDKQQQMPSPENEFGTPGHPPEDPMSGAIDRAADDVQEELEKRAKDHANKKARQKERLEKRMQEIQTPFMTPHKSFNPFSDDEPDPQASSSSIYKVSSGAASLVKKAIPPALDFGKFVLKEGGKKAISAAPYVAKKTAIGAYKGTKAVFKGAGLLGEAIAAATAKKKSIQDDAPIIQKRRPASPQQRERQPVARPLVFDMAKDDEPETRHETKGKRGRPRKV